MFATWILCLFLLMIAPYLTVEAGLLRHKSARRSVLGAATAPSFPWPRRRRGFTLSSFAAKRYILGGILMGIAALLLIKAAPVESVVSLYVFTVVIGLFEVVAVILLIASVEPACASVMR